MTKWQAIVYVMVSLLLAGTAWSNVPMHKCKGLGRIFLTNLPCWGEYKDFPATPSQLSVTPVAKVQPSEPPTQPLPYKQLIFPAITANPVIEKQSHTYINEAPVCNDKQIRIDAEQGIANAQYRLGIMYYRGSCVPRDNIQALMWLNLASASNDKIIVETRNKISTHMTANQIAQAQEMVGNWTPKNNENYYGELIDTSLSEEVVGILAVAIIGIIWLLMRWRKIIINFSQGKLGVSFLSFVISSWKKSTAITKLQKIIRPENYSFRDFISQRPHADQALKDYFSLCEQDPGVKNIMCNYKLTRSDLAQISSSLSANFGWIKGHYAPLSTIAYYEPLLFYVESERCGRSLLYRVANLKFYWEGTIPQGGLLKKLKEYKTESETACPPP